MASSEVEVMAEAPKRAAGADRVEANPVKYEGDWFSRNESIAGVFVDEGGAEGAHSRTGVGVGWAANTPIEMSSLSQ